VPALTVLAPSAGPDQCPTLLGGTHGGFSNAQPFGVILPIGGKGGGEVQWPGKECKVDEERTIVEFERGEGQKVVVRRTQFRGKEYLDFRQFFLSEDGKWLPTKKGVALPWELRQALIEALKQEE